ncbi:hypothetical protein, partial [uncultured Agathobaculum sp.]|uniref:hypothetical protein n=1 Tax=uncultured Agathobaculum sp. TaxID=2048140 RepID=UPI003209C289
PEYIASHLNIFFTQDGEGYVRSGGEDNQDIEVMAWIREAAENIDAEIWSKDDDGLCDELYDNLQYGVEYREGVIAYLYLAVLQAMEMRGRLKDIEDILGDEYDLDSLRELVQADREGRCVVLPSGEYTEEDGQNALKSAMNTCFYHNNSVTRYIADAVAEKLTREAADKEVNPDG